MEKDRFWDIYTVRLEWKPQDLWIGAYIHRMSSADWSVWDLYICLLPCLPIHISRY
jgi:hypothetical protein